MMLWRERRELRARIKHARDSLDLYIRLAMRTKDEVDWNEARYHLSELVERKRQLALGLRPL